MEKDKLTAQDKADIAIMRAVGFTNREIAQKLKVSEPTVSYHLAKFRERAQQVSAQWALAEIILAAGPLYLGPLRDLINLFKR